MRSVWALLLGLALASCGRIDFALTSLPLLELSQVTVPAGGTAHVIATLDHAFAEDVTFSWTTRDGTAMSGTDYETSSGTETIVAGATTTTLVIPTLDHAALDEHATFTIAITALTNLDDGSTRSATTAIVGPSLDLDFAGTFPAGITFARASTATYFDATGTLQTAAADVPRIDHVPGTGASLGFLVEDTQTQLIHNSTATPIGSALPASWAVASNPCPLGTTINVHADAFLTGFNDVDIQFDNSTSSACDIQFQLDAVVPITPSVPYTLSLWTTQIGGNVGGTYFYLSPIYLDAGMAFLFQPATTSVYPPGPLTRFQATDVPPPGAAYLLPTWGMTTVAAGSNFSIRLAAPQLEQGATPTSLIATSGAIVTRAADSATVAPIGAWFDNSGGTVAMRSALSWFPPTGTSSAFAQASLSDGTPANDFEVYFDSEPQTYSYAVTRAGSAVVPPLSAGMVTPGSVQTSVAAYSATAGTVSFSSAGDASTVMTSGPLPAVTQLAIGAGAAATNHCNGAIQSIRYYPAVMSDLEFQDMSR